MKSPQVQAHLRAEASRYSELQVLESGAGYYIGTLYRNPEGYTGPSSRDSDDFPTQEEAEKFLEQLQASGDTDFLRKHP